MRIVHFFSVEGWRVIRACENIFRVQNRQRATSAQWPIGEQFDENIFVTGLIGLIKFDQTDTSYRSQARVCSVRIARGCG